MRSRYTAFFTGNAAYLAQSWHPRTRPEAIDLDPAVRWVGLEIVSVEAGGAGDDAGVVAFRASWVDGGTRGVLHERSRFVRLGGRWVYVDGEVG